MNKENLLKMADYIETISQEYFERRIRYFVEHGLPEDWREQIYGTKPLSYD